MPAIYIFPKINVSRAKQSKQKLHIDFILIISAPYPPTLGPFSANSVLFIISLFDPTLMRMAKEYVDEKTNQKKAYQDTFCHLNCELFKEFLM